MASIENLNCRNGSKLNHLTQLFFAVIFLTLKKIFFSQVGFFILKSDSMSAAREHKQCQLSKSIPDNRFFMEVRIMAKIFHTNHVFILRHQLNFFLAKYKSSFFVAVIAIMHLEGWSQMVRFTNFWLKWCFENFLFSSEISKS